ncbi:HvfC/BufC N-terminal domain-containing protein, partial [Duganella callida]
MNDLRELAAYQDDFIAAVYGAAPLSGVLAAIAAQPGFAVYRNTILKGCADNLAANFPTVLRLVGEPWFHAAALDYARAAPPVEVSLIDYGHDFPAFLAALAPAAELPYLAGVAQLDRLWLAAHTAADAPTLA